MMKRHTLWLALALALAVPAAAQARTYYGFQVGISNAPPPVMVYREEPRVVYVPSSRVYVVEDAPYGDMFRQGNTWYLASNDGWWYSAPSYRGPFRAVDVRMVPRRVFLVPAPHWKHYWKARAHDSNDYAWGGGNHDNGRGYGHGKGNGKGHGKGHGDK